ncbi:MAG TPA: hypothetical protein VM009_02480 [Terriglobales bacterium]|nr:hypothetical protein [Terriglobales bacterium]
MRRYVIAAALLVVAAQAQVVDRMVAPSRSAISRSSGPSIVVQGGTGIRDTFVVNRPRDNNRFFRGGITYYGNRCYRCGLSGAYYNPYYTAPVVYVERYNGPDFSEQPSAYSVYNNRIPEEYVAPGAAAVDAAYRQGKLEERITSLSDEVARLRAEKDGRAAEARRAASTKDESFANAGTLDATTPSAGPINAATATLVFRNGQKLDIANYAIVGRTLWVFDEQRARRIALADLNLDATKKINAENGFEFKIPAQPSR